MPQIKPNWDDYKALEMERLRRQAQMYNQKYVSASDKLLFLAGAFVLLGLCVFIFNFL